MPRAPEASWTMPESTPSRLLRDLLPCMALLVSIKVAWLLLDPTVRLFLGDSGSYLHTALSGWIPPDRSFLYGGLIEATAVRFQSAYALLLTQSLFGIVGGMLLYLWLVAGLKLSRVPALLAAALFASDPAQLFYERMMMAEAVGLLAFLLFFVALSGYVATRRALLIPVYAVLGVTAVAFRINLLAVVLTLSVLAPLITAFGKWRDGASRVRAIGIGFAHLVLSLACTSYAHGYYKQWYAELTATDPGDLYTDHPGYTAQSGVFRLALVAPLIEPAHFRNTGVSPDVLREVTLDYRDPRLREAQIWTEGGLYDVLQRHSDDPDRVARKISIRAAREHPIGLLQLGLLTVLDYFDPAVAAPRLQDDLGRRAPSAELVADLREHLRYDARHARAALVRVGIEVAGRLPFRPRPPGTAGVLARAARAAVRTAPAAGPDLAGSGGGARAVLAHRLVPLPAPAALVRTGESGGAAPGPLRSTRLSLSAPGTPSGAS